MFTVIAKKTDITGILFSVKCLACGSVEDKPAQKARHTRVCRTCGAGRGGGSHSFAGECWLRDMERHNKIRIDREVQIGSISGKAVRVDGMHKNTIYEFLGDYWHGNPRGIRPCRKKYLKTMSRLSALASKYKVVYVWESDYYKGKIMSGLLG